ncbi:shikimate kinase [Clostridium prolinivorans]|uniref:shikimate kinase n=1 Tax=Clostridium prolinivorans TaxID=2769420 RepID=UPI000FD804E7
MRNLNKNIVFIGMPGCGKSTIGKIVSEKINMKFCDLDIYIEEKENMTIDEIFKYGETYFRDIEEKSVKEISKLKGYVISAGGGIVLRKTNIDFLKENGIIIFINRPVDKIALDIDVSKRPLLKEEKNRLYKLYEERYNLYKKYCDFEVENSGTIEESINKIIKILEGDL